MMKRVVLFLATNLAILFLLNIMLRLFGVETIFAANGADLDYGKLLVFAPDRTQAIARMKRALTELRIEGVKTTTPLHLRIMNDKRFIDGTVHTSYIEKELLAK